MVFGLNGRSACGPYGFTCHFFESCSEISIEDITKVVRGFFCGQELPKFVAHTNLVFLPKKTSAKHFTDLRPISLSSFINKIICRMVHERMAVVLPKLFSPTKSILSKEVASRTISYWHNRSQEISIGETKILMW